VVEHLGKADWQDPERVQGMVQSYNERYPEAFWNALLDLIGTEPREVVAEFGPGPGLFLVDTVSKLQTKKVYGIDESESMLKQADEFLSCVLSPDNYILTQHDFNTDAVAMEPSSVDMVFSGFFLHEVDNSQSIIVQAAQSLRPSGVCVVFDFVSGNEEAFVRVMGAHGMDEEKARKRYPHMCKHSVDDIVEFMIKAGLKPAGSKKIRETAALVVGLKD
jgi:ubiquinone/menaquinone biosynthesis C-methylase UbiE